MARKQPKISSIGNPRMAKRRSNKEVMKIRLSHAKASAKATGTPVSAWMDFYSGKGKLPTLNRKK